MNRLYIIILLIAYKGISKILDHKFSHARKFKTDLLLYILGDDANEPEWTPWNKSLGDEETVHKYLNDNFMARFIPKKYTWNKDHPLECLHSLVQDLHRLQPIS